jgi:hypothetical protein
VELVHNTLENWSRVHNIDLISWRKNGDQWFSTKQYVAHAMQIWANLSQFLVESCPWFYTATEQGIFTVTQLEHLLSFLMRSQQSWSSSKREIDGTLSSFSSLPTHKSKAQLKQSKNGRLNSSEMEQWNIYIVGVKFKFQMFLTTQWMEHSLLSLDNSRSSSRRNQWKSFKHFPAFQHTNPFSLNSLERSINDQLNSSEMEQWKYWHSRR